MSVSSIAAADGIVSGKPRFRLDGDRREDLDERLLRLEVCRRENGLDTLEAEFVHWGERMGRQPGFLLEGDHAVRLGTTLVIEAGEDEAQATLFVGTVSRLAGVFSDGLPATMRISAENALMKLRMSRHTRSWSHSDDRRVMEAALSEHGSSATVDAPLAGGHEQYLQVNRTDLATFWERAEATDGRVEIDEEGRVQVVPRRQSDRAAVELEWFDDLISFEVTADLAHQRSEVQVHGYDRHHKRGVHGRAGSSVADAESPNRLTGPRVVEDLDLDAVEHVHVEAPVTDDRADDLARKLAMQRARRFVRGHATVVGTPGLRPGDDVDLQGLDAHFGGRYAVTSVRHVFDRTDGLRTHFACERPFLGDGGAA